MPQQVRTRKHTTVRYSTNNKEVEDLSRGMIIRELYLKLAGAATITAGNNTQANTQRGDEWGVVKRIDIIANGTDNIRSISGTALRWLNMFQYGAYPRVSTALGDGATANPAFASVLILPFWMPRAVRPIDTALDTRELSDLTIEITWGTFTDVNSAASAWTTEPSLTVYALESFGIKGPFSQSRIFAIEETITATNSQFKTRLPVGPMYRGFLINTTDAGVDEGDILNNLKLISGTTVFQDLPSFVIKDVFKIRNELNRSFSGAAYDDLGIGDDNSFEGWYFLDLVTDGFMSEAIDSLGFSELELEADVTVGAGATKLTYWPIQVIPVRGGANG